MQRYCTSNPTCATLGAPHSEAPFEVPGTVFDCFPEALESSEDYLEFFQIHSKLSVWTEIWKLHKIRSNLYEVSTAPWFCQSGGMKSSASLVVLWLQVPAKANKMQRCAKMLK